MPSDAQASALALAAGDAAARGVALVVLAAGFWSLSGILVRLIEAAGPWQMILFRSLSLTATMLLLMVICYAEASGERSPAPGGTGSWRASASRWPRAASSLPCSTPRSPTRSSWPASPRSSRPCWGAGCWPSRWPRRPGAASCSARSAWRSWWAAAWRWRDTGNALALVSAIAFALFSFFLRRGRQSDMLPAILASGVISAGLALLMLLAVERLPLPAASRRPGSTWLCASPWGPFSSASAASATPAARAMCRSPACSSWRCWSSSSPPSGSG